MVYTYSKEILQYVTIWMNFKDIMLSEISQSQKDKYYNIHLYKQSDSQKQKVDWYLPGAQGSEEWGVIV